uniref:WD repeat-containing protein 49 n=2 Tax=Schistocephalus solidus TaxID=70667 RepID=A0A0X3PVZ8_SCHSO
MTSFKDSHTQSGYEQKIEMKLNVTDLIALKEAFSLPGKGYDNKLTLNKDQFIEAMPLILNRGSRQEFEELFDKIDITAEGFVDWDKISSHFVLDYCEREERSNSFSVPQWKDLRNLHSPHKDIIQRILRLKNFSRYLTVSKEGLVTMYGMDLHPQRSAKVQTNGCKTRDLWVVDAVAMPNINKLAVGLTSKEILFCNLNMKLELFAPMKLGKLPATPLCMDYWYNRENHNEGMLAWGDTEGFIHIVFWHMAQTILFEKPPNIPADKEEQTIEVCYDDVMRSSNAASIIRYKAHGDWVRQVRYIAHLDCFISCSTQWANSMSIAWLEKISQSEAVQQEESQVRSITHLSEFCVHQGINAFDYHEGSSLIATAGVNFQVCLWNPYVTSKPNGMLRGHMAPVIAVQFETTRQRLISFSKDNVLRIWDTQLQVSIQKINGVYPKGLEDEGTDPRKQISNTIFFHEAKGRLFITFNQKLTLMEMKPEQTRVFSHDTPVVGAIYNAAFNQVVTVSQCGTISYWLVETGQRVKKAVDCHNGAEVTCLTQDPTGNHFYTGATDGTVKVWDMNAHCHHTLICFTNAVTDISHIVILRRAVIVMGNSKHFTAFKMTNFDEHYVFPSEWKGAPEHQDDVMAGCALPPHNLITASYDGELIVWNTNSDLVSRRMNQRSKSMADIYSDVLLNVSRVTLLPVRTHIRSGSTTGANLVTCGGNGFVRFWNAYACILIGEFVAHPKVSSIIMAIDKTNVLLATADVDGNVKMWNIEKYCLTEAEEQVTSPPPLIAQWAAHTDLISEIVFCARAEKKTVIATASSDCSVCLWTLEGVRLGIFGQEDRWKLDEKAREITSGSGMSTETAQEAAGPVPEEVDAEEDEISLHTEQTPFQNMASKDFSFGLSDILKSDKLDDQDYLTSIKEKLIVWDKTVLGKEYREIRLNKRQRQQPALIADMPFLYGEKLGRPSYGPYYSVAISPIIKRPDLVHPDFMSHPEKYFTNREDFTGSSALLVHSKLPLVEQYVTRQTNMSSSIVPKVKFDEKSLFPPYLLEFDQHMRRLNKYVTKKEADARIAAAAASANNATDRLPAINEDNMVVPRIASGVFPGSRSKRGPFEITGMSAPATAAHGICRDDMTHRKI